jgi:hypothetical protein
VSVKFFQNTTHQELAMAASITVEEERGTYVRSPRHPHNGYYAGDFSRQYVGSTFHATTHLTAQGASS